MVNRDRIKVRQQVDTITYDLEGTISDAIAYLQRLNETYPDARLSYEDISGQYDPNERMGLALYHYVEETDQQYADRIAQEERYEKMREENERQQYEALKAKFEGKA